MPRISAASFRFQRVLVSIRRISSRSASRAAERAMSFSETLPFPLAALAAAESPTVATDSIPTGPDALTVAGGGAIAAAAGGGMTGCGDGVTGRGADGEGVFGHWWSVAAGCRNSLTIGASLPSTTMRLIRFSSCRTLPGHSYSMNIRDSSVEMPGNGLLYCTEYFLTK